jgi:transcriptional repressor NrdR
MTGIILVMLCIYCGTDTKVTNSRAQKRLNQIWRRRNCLNCAAAITTIESVDLSKSIALEHTKGHIEPFLRDILHLSIYDSLKHRKMAAAEAGDLTATIIAELIPRAQAGLLTRAQLIQTAAAVLRRFDTVAAVHYTAYHPTPKS